MNAANFLLTLLAALGVILLTVALLVGFAFWWFKRQMRRLGGQISGIPGAVKTSVAPPTRIHLLRHNTMEGPNAAQTRALSARWRELGARPAGDWTVREIPGLYMHALCEAGERFHVIIYDHPQAGVYTDLHARLQDGGTLTVASAPTGEQMKLRDGHPKYYLKGADSATLLARMESELANLAPIQHIVPDFQAEFERSYAESMDFILGRGGASIEEVRQIAHDSGITNEETIAETHKQTRAQALTQLQKLLKAQFLQTSTLSAARWEEVRDRIVIVHDELPLDHLFFWWIQDTESDENEIALEQRLAGLSARELIARLNDEASPEQSWELLGTVSEPTEADVYAAHHDSGSGL